MRVKYLPTALLAVFVVVTAIRAGTMTDISIVVSKAKVVQATGKTTLDVDDDSAFSLTFVLTDGACPPNTYNGIIEPGDWTKPGLGETTPFKISTLPIPAGDYTYELTFTYYKNSTDQKQVKNTGTVTVK